MSRRIRALACLALFGLAGWLVYRQVMASSAECSKASSGPWLLGEYSLADICIIPVMMRINDIGLAYLWDDCPAVARWFEQFQERTALQNSFYHGSLLSEQYGDVGADTTRTSID